MEIQVNSEVLLINEEDSKESMLVSEINGEYAKCVWRDSNSVPQQKSYLLTQLRLKPQSTGGANTWSNSLGSNTSS